MIFYFKSSQDKINYEFNENKIKNKKIAISTY